MPSTERSITVAASLDDVWEVVADPHHMPRWWPGVRRMEGVEGDRFTQVHVTKRGRPVRMDFLVVESLGPGEAGPGLARRRWEQEVEGTPFQRVLAQSVTEVVLEGSPGRTVVTLAQQQKLRGYSRTGGLLMRRATAGKLAEALEGLRRIFG